MTLFNSRKTANSAIRVLYDIVFLNMAIVLAIHVHYLLYLVRTFEGLEFTFDYFFEQTNADLALWQKYAVIQTVCAIVIFALFGFYNTGRFKRFRERLTFIFLGTVFANVALLLLMHFRVETSYYPRGVTILFFLFTFAFNAMPRLFKPLVIWLAATLEVEPPSRDSVRTVLIIGGGGYIGSVLSRLLIQEGFSVRVLDELLFGDDSIKSLLKHKQYELIKGDCRNIEDLMLALSGADAVVHLAGLVGDPACAVNTELTIDINYAATKMLMDMCKAQQIKRLVFASTCSVYGVGEHMLTEESELNPVSLYARTKIDSENVLLDGMSGDFRPTILRFATVFGTSARPRFDLVVNTFVAKSVLEGKIEVFGGNQWRPFVHTFDISRAIVKVLRADLKTVGGQIFNVGDDSMNLTISDLAEKVVQHLPKTEIVNHGDTEDPRNYRVSFAKIRKALGFQCSVDIDAGIRELIDTVQSQEQLDITSELYNNHTQAQEMVAAKSEVTQNRIHMADRLQDGWIREQVPSAKIVGED